MGNCCCGTNQNESCGWPKGTVRAAISIIIIVLTFALAGAGIIILIFRDEIVYAMGILSTIFTIISAVIAYYFGSKTGEAAGKAIVESSERRLAEKDREISRSYSMDILGINNEENKYTNLYRNDIKHFVTARNEDWFLQRYATKINGSITGLE